MTMGFTCESDGSAESPNVASHGQSDSKVSDCRVPILRWSRGGGLGSIARWGVKGGFSTSSSVVMQCFVLWFPQSRDKQAVPLVQTVYKLHSAQNLMFLIQLLVAWHCAHAHRKAPVVDIWAAMQIQSRHAWTRESCYVLVLILWPA